MSWISEDKGRVLILFLQKLRSSQSDDRLKAHHSDISADSGGLYCGDTLCVQAVTAYLGLALAVCGDQEIKVRGRLWCSLAEGVYVLPVYIRKEEI